MTLPCIICLPLSFEIFFFEEPEYLLHTEALPIKVITATTGNLDESQSSLKTPACYHVSI